MSHRRAIRLAVIDISLSTVSQSHLVGVPAMALLWQRGTFGQTLQQLLRKVDLQLTWIVCVYVRGRGEDKER